jgi:hypothetical protein
MLVHGTYLVHDSEFFSAALKKEWLEGKSRIIQLPEECTDTVAHYVTFTYLEKLPTSDMNPLAWQKYAELEPVHQASFDNCFNLLVRLYVCGEKFLNRAIQRAVIKELFRHMAHDKNESWGLESADINIMYCGTPEGSPGRRFLVDWHIRKGSEKWLDSDLDPAFVLDIAKAFTRIVENKKSLEEVYTDLKAEDYL